MHFCTQILMILTIYSVWACTTLGENFNGDYLSIKDAVNRIKLPGALSLGKVNVPMKGDARTKLRS